MATTEKKQLSDLSSRYILWCTAFDFGHS